MLPHSHLIILAIVWKPVQTESKLLRVHVHIPADLMAQFLNPLPSVAKQSLHHGYRDFKPLDLFRYALQARLKGLYGLRTALDDDPVGFSLDFHARIRFPFQQVNNSPSVGQ